MDPAFQSHRLNEAGLAKAKEIGESFDALLASLPKGDPRCGAIVKTKLEEACFFAKKAMAVLAEYQVAPLLFLLGSVLFAPSTALAQDAVAAAPKSPLELVLQYVVAPLLALLAPVLVAAVAKLATYLHAKESESKAARVGAVLADSASAVVADLNATLKPKLLEALKDGVLTDKEKAELRDTALEALKTKLPASLLASASKQFGPLLDQVLAGTVEQAVAKAKAVDAVANPPSP